MESQAAVLVKAVAWDLESMTARMTDDRDRRFEGTVTRVQTHNESGQKVNLEFATGGASLLGDLIEVVVFSVDQSHRMIAVIYDVERGSRHVHATWGSYYADCLTL